MMIEPPIDKLIDSVGCKYALVCLLTKRVRFLLTKKSEVLSSSGDSAITFAAKELAANKIKVAYEE